MNSYALLAGRRFQCFGLSVGLGFAYIALIHDLRGWGVAVCLREYVLVGGCLC